MGQGTWGMCDDDFDHIGNAIDDIRPDIMSTHHLKNKIRWAERKKMSALCTYDEDQWDEAIGMMQDEYYSRITSKANNKESKPKAIKAKKAVKGAKLKMKCHCGGEYEARKADINRGWGLSCSKSCSATRREYGRPAATIIKGDSKQ